jgi:hypothetical protein
MNEIAKAIGGLGWAIFFTAAFHSCTMPRDDYTDELKDISNRLNAIQQTIQGK